MSRRIEYLPPVNRRNGPQPEPGPELELEIDPPGDPRALLAISAGAVALFAIVTLGVWKLVELVSRAL